ncbi:MAG TPA: hypothetical protein PKL92_03405, partial [Aquaticitalea sp.]|nr:hypothetical protein [Aquaticitalea sp.]
MSNKPLNFLCITTFFKGEAFLESCKAEGNNVYLLTKNELKDEAWPWNSIDDVYYIEEWNHDNVIKGIAYKFRSIKFDRFVALDDFDVEKVALLREHFRMPGMGHTTAHYFRDKLAMRMKAKEEGVNVPEFTGLFHDADINAYADRVSPPWLIKPRSEASATGIKKIHSKDDLWNVLNELGDERDKYLIEKFAPGDVYHVDGLNMSGKVVFSRVSKYLDTPFEVAHGGGIFRSATCEMGSKDEKLKFNDLAYSFMILPDDIKKNFTPLKYFEENNVGINDFLKSISDYINTNTVNNEKSYILRKINQYKKLLKIKYQKDNVLV